MAPVSMVGGKTTPGSEAFLLPWGSIAGSHFGRYIYLYLFSYRCIDSYLKATGTTVTGAIDFLHTYHRQLTRSARIDAIPVSQLVVPTRLRDAFYDRLSRCLRDASSISHFSLYEEMIFFFRDAFLARFPATQLRNYLP